MSVQLPAAQPVGPVSCAPPWAISDSNTQPKQLLLPIVSHGLALTLLSLRKVAFIGHVHIMVVITVITEYVKFLLLLSARNHDGSLAS